jgi:membrane protein DedA with SNARE-associated domain
VSRILIELIATGGIAAIFVTMALESAGIPISSEVVVPLGGALASGAISGKHLDFAWVVAAASGGNLVGSLVAYLLTRRYGEAIILGPGRRIGLSAGHLRLAHRVFDRWGLAAVFAGRLLPIIRTYISFPAGLSDIRLVPFGVATILGAIPWNFALAYAGLKLGDNYEHVGKVLGPFTIPVAIVLVALLGVAYYYGRRIGESDSSGRSDPDAVT